jgi:L-cysteate sulfo-lyase
VIPLDRFARVSLCHRPTPLELMPRLTDFLAGPPLLVKRDDCTGLALGGNKARKLEFLMADALAKGADTVLTTGGVQSNHCRQTAAAAAKLGLACELILPHVSRFDSPTYETGGNVLVDQLLGARLHILAAGADVAARTSQVLDEIRASGGTPYVIPVGGSNPIGALGYVDAAGELARQVAERKLTIDTIVITTGSCTTHAGLLVGLEAIRMSGEFDFAPRVIGISVYQRREAALALVRDKAAATAELIGIDPAGLHERTVVLDDYLGAGYGEPTDAMVEAVGLAARLEGLLVDPVYTGKTLSGLIDLARRGQFGQNESVLFWHTGGTPALFPYRDAFARLLAAEQVGPVR